MESLAEFDETNPQTRKALREIIARAVQDNQQHLDEVERGDYLGSGCIFIAKVKAGLLAVGCDPAEMPETEAFNLVTWHLQRISGQDNVSAAWRETVGNANSVGDEDDPIEYFFAYWSKITPYGENPLSRALRSISEHPDLYALDLPDYRAGYRLFLQLCHALARGLRSSRFYISRKHWADYLGVSMTMVTRYTQLAQRDGILKLAAPAKPHRLAATYEIDTVALSHKYGVDSGPRSV